MLKTIASAFTSLSQVIQDENYWDRRVADAYRTRHRWVHSSTRRKLTNDNIRLMIGKLRAVREVYDNWNT